MTLPPFCDRERAGAETADIEPAAWSVDPAGSPGRSPSPCHSSPQTIRPSRRRCSPRRRLEWQACPCPGRRPRCFRHSTSWSPRRSPSPCPARRQIADRPKLLANVPPPWIVSTPVPFRPTDRFRANAPGVVISVELGVTVSMFASIVCLGKPPIPVATQEPIRGELSGPVGGLRACRNRGRCEKRDRRKGRRRTKLPSPPRQQRAPCGRRASVRQYMPPIHTGPLLRVVRLHDRNVIALRAVETRHQ